jgi:solute carrier family 25 phosphate transporter 23/24/25/41
MRLALFVELEKKKKKNKETADENIEPRMKSNHHDGLTTATLSEKAIGKMREDQHCEPRQHTETIPGGSHGSGSGRQETATSEQQSGFDGAGKYLLSGGIAGAISRTATAPFDRLKVYLITAQPTRSADGTACRMTPRSTMSNLMDSLKLIYNEHSNCHTSTPQHRSRNHTWGLKNFFIGNGLNVIKVFPESAIKFFVYEYAKNSLIHHPLARSSSSDSDRSNLVRFLAGGLAGVVSQVLIYPIETLSQSSLPPLHTLLYPLFSF